MFGWLCNFMPCNHIHIAGNVWQCSRCKTCSFGRNLHEAEPKKSEPRNPALFENAPFLYDALKLVTSKAKSVQANESSDKDWQELTAAVQLAEGAMLKARSGAPDVLADDYEPIIEEAIGTVVSGPTKWSDRRF